MNYATDLTDALSKISFEVTLVIDYGHQPMDQLIHTFVNIILNQDLVFEYKEQNDLVPVDDDEKNLKRSKISMCENLRIRITFNAGTRKNSSSIRLCSWCLGSKGVYTESKGKQIPYRLSSIRIDDSIYLNNTNLVSNGDMKRP